MKRLVVVAAAAILSMILAGCAESPVFTETRELSLSAAEIDTLELDSGNGDVGITGRSGADMIKVTAEIHAAGTDQAEMKKTLEQDLIFSLEKRGNRAVLRADYRKPFFLLGLFKKETQKINLNIELPQSIALSIKKDNGNLYISDIRQNISLIDERGGIILDKITGDVSVHDDAGDMILSKVKGKIEIADKSGNIQIDSCSGELTIEDTTDAILLSGFQGPVHISDTGGQIQLEKVKGPVNLKARGRGEVVLKDISGDITQNF